MAGSGGKCAAGRPQQQETFKARARATISVLSVRLLGIPGSRLRRGRRASHTWCRGRQHLRQRWCRRQRQSGRRPLWSPRRATLRTPTAIDSQAGAIQSGFTANKAARSHQGQPRCRRLTPPALSVSVSFPHTSEEGAEEILQAAAQRRVGETLVLQSHGVCAALDCVSWVVVGQGGQKWAEAVFWGELRPDRANAADRRNRGAGASTSQPRGTGRRLLLSSPTSAQPRHQANYT